VRRFAGERDRERGQRQGVALDERHVAGMHHDRGVHTAENPGIGHDRLATAALFGGRAKDFDRPHAVRQRLPERQRRTQRPGRDQVMSTGMAQLR